MARKSASIPRSYVLPHLRIDPFAKELDYTPHRPTIPFIRREGHDRVLHGAKLTAELERALASAKQQRQLRDPLIAVGKPNAYFEVTSDINKLLPEKGWRQDVRVGAVRRDPSGAQVGTLFVTEAGEMVLADAITNYKTSAKATASNERVDQIESIAPGSVASLWMDRRVLPQKGQRIWWECWCWPDKVNHILHPAQSLRLRVSEQRLHFPDFEVVPVYATIEDMERLLANTDAVEELRHASDSPHVYTHDLIAYQKDILADLVARVTPPPTDAPAVCILDTGVAHAHPLLSPSLAADDCYAVDEAWKTDDHDGHGTEMAGIALYGDLTYPVGDHRSLTLTHRLESVKLLPPKGFPPNEPASLGYITQSAISQPEIEKPHRLRVFSMPVTNEGLSGAWPTTWSAALDRAAAGLTQDDDASGPPSAPPRLILTSAGNVPDSATPEEAGDLSRFPIEDPAQAWNALTVGGFTDKNEIADPRYSNWTAAAEVGDRSPYSCTSTSWIDAPIKPELMLEAGNRALSPMGNELVAGIESLSLLTTNRDFIVDPLGMTWATSAATSQAARMAATLMAEFPDFWPETIRALMVHSAEWTPRMLDRFRQQPGKTKALLLAREFGYGVPNLDRALKSARNDLALVAQKTIQPFIMPTKPGKRGTPVNDGPPRFRHLDFYRVPWPIEALEGLGESRVELKVTLSYFVEPSPGQFAPKTPARYRSHGLRFDLQNPLEDSDQFLARINALAAAEEEAETEGEPIETIAEEVEWESEDIGSARTSKAADPRWRFGSKSRSGKAAGSIHCDVWTGSGAELAARHALAVYPVIGWWKTRSPKKRFDSEARYALIMTLKSLDKDIDLHAAFKTAIRIAQGIEV